MKLIIKFKDDISKAEIAKIKHTIFQEVILDKDTSSLNRFKDLIDDFNFVE